MVDVLGIASFRPRAILDLGCGPATATIAVSSVCDPSAAVTLVDGSGRMLQAAQALIGRNIRMAVHGDFTEPRVADAVFARHSYDLVLCSFALHHLDDAKKRATLERIAGSLVPRGLLLLADEVVSDRPGGWDLVERVRARIIAAHLHATRIAKPFWDLETTLPPELHLPFLPTRVDDLTSFLARSGLAVSCPVSILGSALLVGVKAA
jgi:SAM-dependent methyltransferase